MDALDSRSDRQSPIAGTGSLRGDLRVFGEDVLAKLTSSPWQKRTKPGKPA